MTAHLPHTDRGLRFGWAQADITPELPIAVEGQFHVRMSEEVMDPLTVTALVLQSGREHIVFVSCDLVYISDKLRDSVRKRLNDSKDGPDPRKVILNATHTHTGPGNMEREESTGSGLGLGVELDVMSVDMYVSFAVERIGEAVLQAWNSRKEGGIAYGMDYAVVGRNRRWVNDDDKATMYGLNAEISDRFRHFEGYEDHSVNVVAVYDSAEALTGLLVNVPCPSQETESLFAISADWWCETRAELRRRFGGQLFILPQCSAAGELTSHLMYEREANERMLKLRGKSAREEIGIRIADAVERILPFIAKEIDWAPVLRHDAEIVYLEANRLTEDDLRSAIRDAEQCREEYEKEKRKLEERPELRETPRWYVPVTSAYRRMNWHKHVVRRCEQMKRNPVIPAELHVLRLGDIAFATNPFECYLDYGIQIKVRSRAVQTFLVQLAGGGTYLPSPRSVRAGGYGSVPASNPVGAEGGQQLVEHTVRMMRSLWEEAGEQSSQL